MKYSEDNPKIEMHDVYGSSNTGGSGINVDRKGSFSILFDVKDAKTVFVDRTVGDVGSIGLSVEGVLNDGLVRLLTFAYNERGIKYADITQYDQIKFSSSFGDTTVNGGTKTWMACKILKIY